MTPLFTVTAAICAQFNTTAIEQLSMPSVVRSSCRTVQLPHPPERFPRRHPRCRLQVRAVINTRTSVGVVSTRTSVGVASTMMSDWPKTSILFYMEDRHAMVIVFLIELRHIFHFMPCGIYTVHEHVYNLYHFNTFHLRALSHPIH